MNLLSVLKQKYADVIREREVALRERRQLNMVVDRRLVALLKRLSDQLTVTRDIFGEQVLEIGCYYLTRAMEDEEKTKLLRQHLIDLHLIDSGADDSEAILRIGEGGNISKLLVQVEPVLRSWRAFRHALAITKRTGNFAYLKKCEKQLLQSAVGLASWIEKHHLDQADSGETLDRRYKVDMDS